MCNFERLKFDMLVYLTHLLGTVKMACPDMRENLFSSFEQEYPFQEVSEIFLSRPAISA